MLDINKVYEVRFHGRGGQGVVTAANLLVDAACRAGLWGQAFPFFGAERRGAPVLAFARISRRRIRIRSMVKEPDVIVVLDPKLPEITDVFQGLKPGGIAILNTSQKPRKLNDYRLFYVNANNIALRLGLVLAGWPLVNTAMLGAVARATNLVGLNHVIESVSEGIHGDLAKLNVEAVKTAYEEVMEVE